MERRSRPVGWRTWMCAIKKVTKETLRRPRAAVLRTPVPCAPRSVEGRCGNSLRSDTRTSSPSPDLRCSARSRRTGRSRSTATASMHGVDLSGVAVALDVGSALSEPSIAGESGAQRRRCLSEASSAPSPDSPRSAGCRRGATARGLAACFFGYFLDGAHPCAPPYGPATPFHAAPAARCTSKESDTPPQSRKRSAGMARRDQMRGRSNENGTFAGAVSMNRSTRNLRTSRRTPPRSQCSPAPSAATRPPSGCRPRSGGCPGHGCPCGPRSRP